MSFDPHYAFGGRQQRALRRSARHRCASVLTSSDRERDRVTQTDMVQCVHGCGAHWQWIKGSGKLRGWCSRCNGWFCGPQCEECISQEQVLENMEAGMPYHLARRRRVVKVSVGGVLLGRA